MLILRSLIVIAVLIAALGVSDAKTILHRGNLGDPGTLDPAKQGLTSEYEIMNDLFVGLVQNSIEGLPIPGVAESWSTSSDGRITTFMLRKGLV